MKKKICSVVPDARTLGVGAGAGGVGGQTGTLEAVINYNTGQVSGFASGGAQVGWNGGAQANIFTGFIYGIGDNNGKYSGGFTSFSGSAVAGGYISHSSGGLTNGAQGMLPSGNVTAFGVSAGMTLIPTPTAGASVTNYSQPVSLGKYWPLLNPFDLSLFLAKKVCK